MIRPCMALLSLFALAPLVAGSQNSQPGPLDPRTQDGTPVVADPGGEWVQLTLTGELAVAAASRSKSGRSPR